MTDSVCDHCIHSLYTEPGNSDECIYKIRKHQKWTLIKKYLDSDENCPFNEDGWKQ